MFSNIGMGIALAFTLTNILGAFVGVVLGICFGALPGFTATMGIAVLIPVTYGMDPVLGLIFLASIYCGSFYGGSVSAILLHTPGTPAAAATTLDGYEMTKQGRANEALTEAVCASFWGGIISVFALLFLAPPLAKFSLKFGPQEKFMLAIFGLSIIASLSAKSMTKGLMGGVLGLLFGCVGTDPVLGFPRFTFGITTFITGIPLIPALIGIYSVSQAISLASMSSQYIVDLDSLKSVKKSKVSLRDVVRYPLIYIRSGIIGTIVGIIPGAGANIAAFLSYNQGKMMSKNPEKFGNGSREAIACSEAANNAVTGGSLIPMLTLGIPGNSVTAILLGGLMIQGLVPGNELFTTKAAITYPFIIGIFIANIFMLLVGLFGAKYFAKITNTPINVLIAAILALSVIGSYAIGNSIQNVYVMVAFGIIGYFLKINSFNPSPIILGMILGPIAEEGFVQSMIVEGSTMKVLSSTMTRPISAVLMIMTIVSLAMPLIQEARHRKKSLKKAKAV